MKKTILMIVAVLFIVALPLAAQQQSTSNGDKDLEETLERLSRDLAKAYVGPVASGFGSDLNAAWFHRSPKPTVFDFDLEFGVVVMSTLFADDHRHFSTSGVFQFDSTQANTLISNINDPNYNNLPPPQKEQARTELINQIRGKDFTVGVSGATIIGAKDDSVRVQFNGGQFTFTDPLGQQRTVTVPAHSVALPVGGLLGDAKLFGEQMIPLASPQLTFGTVFGTMATIRYVPEIEIDKEFGKVKFFGFGLQHNPMIWLGGDFPVDISANFFTQTLEAGTVFEATATTYGISASKTLGWGALNVTPYVGFMLESSNLTFSYDYEIDSPAGPIPQNITFELEGQNTSRLTLGVGFKLVFLNINADYNIGTYNSFSAGVMVII